MSNLDPAVLARVQFAFTVSFHIIFPTISFGLGVFLAIVEGLWLTTNDETYLQIYRLWVFCGGLTGETAAQRDLHSANPP